MAINNQPTIEPRTVTGIFTRYIAKTLPLAFDESMSYYECLCALLKYLNDTIVPDINNVNDGLGELQTFYNELQSYVNNYFDNLDVQDEINNKLDDMAESGQLTDIIAQYLGLAGMITFDTVADMKLAENLVNGSKCRTLGHSSYNDGGGALYKIRQITNDDVIDEMTIIEVYDNLLVAELIINDNTINFRQVGDNWNIISNTNINKIIFEKDTYNVESTITLNRRIELDFNGSTVNYEGNSTLFNITTLYNEKPVIKNGKFYGTTSNTFITSNRNAWGASFDLLDSDIFRFNYILDCTENFNNYIKGVNVSSNGVIRFTGTDISNSIKFEKCYFKTYDATTDVYPDYRILLTMVRNMEFNSCSFEQCKTLFSLTNSNYVNINNCNFEDMDYISNNNTNAFKINENNGFLNNVRGIYENETIKGLPYGNYLHGHIYNNVTDTQNEVRYTARNNSSLPQMGSYATSSISDDLVYLYRYTDKEINHFIPVNKFISKQETAGTAFTIGLTNITKSQKYESILYTIYNIFTSSGEDNQVWKSQWLQRNSNSVYNLGNECVKNSTWSGSPLYGNTITESCSNTQYSVTSTASCKKVTIICYEMLGDSLIL